MSETAENGLPAFVRPLHAGGDVEAEPLALESEAEARLHRNVGAMRDARDAASASARKYIVHGGPNA